MTVAAGLLDAWGAAMFRASWQGGLVVLAVWGLCRVAPSMPARWRCWLWRLALLKFLVALAWFAPLEIPLLSRSTPAKWEGGDSSLPEATEPSDALVIQDSGAGSVSPWVIPFSVWSALAGWQLARILTSFRHARRLRADCRPVQNRTALGRMAELSKSVGLSAPPDLMESSGQGSPFLLGLLRPAIVLPTATLDRLDAAEQTIVLLHELAHVRRRDLMWSVVAAVVRAIFWFHPLVWLSKRQSALAQEIAADELAIANGHQSVVGYATMLVSIVGKLGPARSLSPVSIAVTGTHRSLKARLSAMRFLKPASRPRFLAYGLIPAIVAALGVVPWTLVAADPKDVQREPSKKAVEQNEESKPTVAEPKEKPSRPEDDAKKATKPPLKTGKGAFVSFRDGVLTLEGKSGPLTWAEIDEQTNVFLATGEDVGKDRGYRPVAALDALAEVKPGTPVFVGPWFGYEKRPGVFIGVNRAKSVGTFVSYKDGTLSLLLKGPPQGSYTKKYGNNLSIRNVPGNIPVEESIDGGDYESIGTVKSTMEAVREGTVVTVHYLGEGNITLIQLGLPKQK